MAKRPPITPVSAGQASININQNFNRIAEQFDNTLSRDGSGPNFLSADLDMNSNDLLNIGRVDAEDFSIDGQDIVEYVDDLVGSSFEPYLTEINQAVEDAQNAASTAAEDAAAQAVAEVTIQMEGFVTDAEESAEEAINAATEAVNAANDAGDAVTQFGRGRPRIRDKTPLAFGDDGSVIMSATSGRMIDVELSDDSAGLVGLVKYPGRLHVVRGGMGLASA